MEDIMNIIVQNGIGVASFVALLYFVKVYLSKMQEAINNISITLTSIKDSLLTLSTRVDDIENKIKDN